MTDLSQQDSPLGYLEACLLLALAERPAYGYELTKRVEELGTGTTDRGRIYRALRAMEGRGLVASRWDVAGRGPARRTYEVAAEGHAQLDGHALAVRRRRRHLSRFLARYEGVRTAESGAVA